MPVVSNPIRLVSSWPTIRYPFAYFSAPLALASRIADITGMPLWDAVARYSAFQKEVTGASFQAEPNHAVWSHLLQATAEKGWREIAQIAYALYLEQPYARFDAAWTPSGSTRFGALGVDTSPYNLSRNQVKLHFLPTRNGVSDLASSRLRERRADMKQLLGFVRSTHPEIRYFTSSTWLQNLPNYRALFPPAFVDRLDAIPDAWLGVWGQFVIWDGRANTPRYTALLGNLQRSRTFDDIIESIPLKVLGAREPIEVFYDFYDRE